MVLATFVQDLPVPDIVLSTSHTLKYSIFKTTLILKIAILRFSREQEQTGDIQLCRSRMRFIVRNWLM